MHGGDKKVLNEIFFFRGRTNFSLTAAPLGPVERNGVAFDVSLVRNRHGHVFIDHQVLDGDVLGTGNDLSSSLVAVLLFDLVQFFDDDFVDLLFVRQDGSKFPYEFAGFPVFLHNFIALQASQSLKT